MKSRKSRNSSTEILIAEDSPTQAEKLQYMLEEHGYAVVVARDGKQALAAARRHKPALIVTDVMMPEMDGFALCREIKRDGVLKDVPVILLTTLSDVRDIMKGLECGADNFIRKPYEERYLLARVDYLLMNSELRKSQKMQMGLEIHLGGQTHFITAERQQIVDLLISVYEEAIHLSEELKLRQDELADSNRALTGLYHVAEGLNHAVSERDVCDSALEHALELPGVRAGWISLREGESGFRLAAARNLPPALLVPGAMDGLCECRRRLLTGGLDHVTNILQCERLGKAKGDTQGLRYHASVPLWSGDRILGVMNLVGADQGMFRDDELETLYSVGHQVGIALERARLHEHLEQLVAERTAALTAEIAERRRAEAALSASERNYRTVADFTYDWEFWMTLDGCFAYVSPSCRRISGYAPEKFVEAASLLEIAHGEDLESTRLELKQALLQEVQAGFDFRILTQDGLARWVSMAYQPARDAAGEFTGVRGSIRDITRRKTDEARIIRLNRIYSVLSGINTTIVRVREPQELFDEACRVAVEHGQFLFAWIGTLDADRRQLTPVARAGRDDGYLDQINLSSIVDAPGNCPLTAAAITQMEPVICNDIATDDRIRNWRGEALKRGYRSVVVLPLVLEGQPVGVFALYASEPEVFDGEEMDLLVEIAGDISFALDHIGKAARLDYLAYFDAITGLPNRALFHDRVEQRIGAAHHDRKAFSVIMLDLERFGGINDSLGRLAGDSLLRQLAQRLEQMLDETHVLARLSADYFGIATRRGGDGMDIAHLLQEVLSGIQKQPFLVAGQELRVSARAGVSSYPADGEDAETLLRNAEAALKRAKLSGDRQMFYAPEFNAQIVHKLSLENKLRQALEQEQLVLHYQPKVDLDSGQISGLEALMRWNDPDTGLVPPLQFIPLLEETGMILEAGQWALEKAVADSLLWQAKGLRSPRISVNVSPIQLQQKDFVGMIERVVKGDSEVAGRLELEITESLVMHDIVANIEKLRLIREMGVEVAIDDFGTGYSSLSYIAKLPVGTLKIDRVFIMNMAGNADDLSIVTTIISLAHSLKMRVVAEGVETREQARLLRLLKCDEMQGFLFSPAVPAGQIEEFLREGKALPR